MRNIVLLGCVVFLAAWVGCNDGSNTAAPNNDDNHADEHADEHGHGHHHEAPNGGCLIVLGDHFAHVEFLVDGETGEIVVYILGGHAANAVRVAQESLELKVTISETETITVSLAAVESALTGESVGDTSEFKGQHDGLKGMATFKAVLTELTVKGKTLTDIEVDYPEGNEG